ncbi:MAG: HhH-GPD family protein [Parcubacteria group bacterium]|nr:HhH-GPD family protein [Parcubacteria group bacterium]
MSTKKRTAVKKDQVKVAMAHLKKVDPLMHAAALPYRKELGKKITHRRGYKRDDLFAALAGSVVGQQLSVKAADTIWERLRVASGGAVTPEAIKKLRVPTMRKAGLSAAKIKTLKELSNAVLIGNLDLPALRKVPEEEAITRLSSIWGIGRWTAEMFLMFALDREDVFSSGDLALRRAVETIYNLPKDTPLKTIEAIAASWTPHRTFASRVLWMTRD